MKKLLFVLVILTFSFGFAQEVVPVMHDEEDSGAIAIPFAVLDEIPQFEACKDSIEKSGRDCFFQKMSAHINKNLKYPEEAKQSNIQGRVTVMFLINKEGVIENIRVRGPKNGELLEQEAVRIIKLLPKFIPGKYRGKAVNVEYAQPILFRL